jgi:hypothetical protein
MTKSTLTVKRIIMAACLGTVLGATVGIARADAPRVQIVAADESSAIELTRHVRATVAGCESARWEYRGATYVVTCDR